MLKLTRSQNDKSNRQAQETPQAAITGTDKPADTRSRAAAKCSRNLPARRNSPSTVLSVEKQIQGSGNLRVKGDKTRAEEKSRPREAGNAERDQRTKRGSLPEYYRIKLTEKKRELGLEGNLKGKRLPDKKRREILYHINTAQDLGLPLETICEVLELSPRAVYRWRNGDSNAPRHGGGGGKNKITPTEEKQVLRVAKKYEHFSVRRIAYHLEQKAICFIGKTTVAEVLQKHGLNRPNLRVEKQNKSEPADMLSYEPWRKNLTWGMDWTWLRVAGAFMFLLVLVDWYSRKIIAWGLYHSITKYEVVAVVTESVAIERIDELPEDAMKPRLVADHGSANVAKYTKENIEVQGLELWLSGVGRPTGNARTERTIGTLKIEEITLQGEYENEQVARKSIALAIDDYNCRRPNAGNGGFAPNTVHHVGRKILFERRKNARQFARNKRNSYWSQKSGSKKV